jgi:hypothetical protein
VNSIVDLGLRGAFGDGGGAGLVRRGVELLDVRDRREAGDLAGLPRDRPEPLEEVAASGDVAGVRGEEAADDKDDEEKEQMAHGEPHRERDGWVWFRAPCDPAGGPRELLLFGL